jgi:hypothetical protein
MLDLDNYTFNTTIQFSSTYFVCVRSKRGYDPQDIEQVNQYTSLYVQKKS